MTTTIKSLNIITPRFCNDLDVISTFPKIVTESMNMDESDSPIVRYSYLITPAIINATREVIAALTPIYKNTTNLEATAAWVGAIVSNKQNSDPTAKLLACQVGTSATCEMFTLTFASSTGYSVVGSVSGSVGSGNTYTDFTSSGDGDLIIPASSVTGLFSGTFASGDKVFVSINKWDATIASICTYKATAEVLRGVFFSESINDESNLIEKLSNRAQRILDKLQRPYDDDGYALSTLPSRDFSEIQLGSWNYEDSNSIVDRFGTFDSDDMQEDQIDSYTS